VSPALVYKKGDSMRWNGKSFALAAAVVAAMLMGTAMAGNASRGVRSGGLAPSASPDKPATVIIGACPTVGTHFVTADDTGKSTTSTTYVDVPNMSVTFVQGRAGCVLVNFSAWTFAPGDALLFVEALMDGVTVAAPGEVQLSGDDDEDVDGSWARAHAFNFAIPAVSAGSHTIKIQFRSYDGKMVFIHRRSLMVQHH
jgi:hypothetical protein